MTLLLAYRRKQTGACWLSVVLGVALLCVGPVRGQAPSLSAQPQRVFVGERVLFEGAAAEAQDPEGTYVIYFGDGDSLSVAPPDYTAHHTYYEAGPYQATLVARLANAVLRSAPVAITVEPVELRLYFTGESPFTERSLVTFTARFHPPLDQFQVPPDLLYMFHFGEDAASSWQADPEIKHRFPRKGVYQIYARARDATRVLVESPVLTLNVDSTILAVTQGAPIPELNLYPSTDTIGEGDSVTFAVVLEPKIQGAEYRIHFGDGSPAVWTSQDTLSHVYRRSGRFETYAEARRDGMLLGASLPSQIGVRALYVLVLETDTTRVPAGMPVRFTGALNPPTEGALYQFTFGDEPPGAWQPEAEADHVFERPGPYAVALTARLDGRIYRSEALAMAIEPAPPPQQPPLTLSLHYDPGSPRPREPVVFKATGTPAGAPVEYRFLFGDGDTTAWSAAPQATHSYAGFGSYEAAVEARGIQGTVLQRSSRIVPIARAPFAGTWPWWLLIILFILILVIIIWFFWLRRWMGGGGGAAAGSELAVTPHLDPGIPQIAVGHPLDFQVEVRLRPVKDTGQNKIETTGDLITQEQRSHARESL